MPLLRLAYSTQFLIALIAIFVLWSQVGGQSHLDLMPWYLKLGLGAGAAFATVKATVAAVAQERPWSGSALKWLGITLALLVGCGMASYYYHLYGESDETDEPDQTSSALVPMASHPDYRLFASAWRPTREQNVPIFVAGNFRDMRGGAERGRSSR